jgi:hypothetical protein
LELGVGLAGPDGDLGVSRTDGEGAFEVIVVEKIVVIDKDDQRGGRFPGAEDASLEKTGIPLSNAPGLRVPGEIEARCQRR